MADIDATITNNTNSKVFSFRGVHNWRTNKTQPVQSIPFVNQDSENNVLFRFFGQTEGFSFSFALFDDGVDVSGGDGINTINEQISYLRGTIFTEDFDDTWTLVQARHIGGAGISGVIEDLDVSDRGGTPSLLIGTIRFKVGTVEIFS